MHFQYLYAQQERTPGINHTTTCSKGMPIPSTMTVEVGHYCFVKETLSPASRMKYGGAASANYRPLTELILGSPTGRWRNAWLQSIEPKNAARDSRLDFCDLWFWGFLGDVAPLLSIEHRPSSRPLAPRNSDNASDSWEHCPLRRVAHVCSSEWLQ